MSNTSATGGYLRDAAAHADMTALENGWHDILAGITGLDNKLVRPSRQVEPTKQPANNVDWVAFEITRAGGDPWLDVRHDSAGDGRDVVTDHAFYDVRAAFYGPAADELAGAFRRGLYVWQNRAALRAAGLALHSVESPRTVPELDGMRWRSRVDVVARFIAERRGKYAVLNLLRSQGTITGDDGTRAGFDTEEVKNNG